MLNLNPPQKKQNIKKNFFYKKTTKPLALTALALTCSALSANASYANYNGLWKVSSVTCSPGVETQVSTESASATSKNADGKDLFYFVLNVEEGGRGFIQYSTSNSSCQMVRTVEFSEFNNPVSEFQMQLTSTETKVHDTGCNLNFLSSEFFADTLGIGTSGHWNPEPPKNYKFSQSGENTIFLTSKDPGALPGPFSPIYSHVCKGAPSENIHIRLVKQDPNQPDTIAVREAQRIALEKKAQADQQAVEIHASVENNLEASRATYLAEIQAAKDKLGNATLSGEQTKEEATADAVKAKELADLEFAATTQKVIADQNELNQKVNTTLETIVADQDVKKTEIAEKQRVEQAEKTAEQIKAETDRIANEARIQASLAETTVAQTKEQLQTTADAIAHTADQNAAVKTHEAHQAVADAAVEEQKTKAAVASEADRAAEDARKQALAKGAAKIEQSTEHLDATTAEAQVNVTSAHVEANATKTETYQTLAELQAVLDAQLDLTKTSLHNIETQAPQVKKGADDEVAATKDSAKYDIANAKEIAEHRKADARDAAEAAKEHKQDVEAKVDETVATAQATL